jgi:hypothetical protein
VLTRSGWLCVPVAVSIVCLTTVLARAAVTIIGDQSAYNEVVAAFQKLFSLPGFRAKSTDAQGQARGIFEFAPPNNWHITATAPNGGAFETIRVDGRVATRMNLPGQPAGWRCGTSKTDRPIFDPTTAAGTYNMSRGPDTVIDRVPVHTIAWNDGTKRTTYYIGVQNGLPKRAVSERDTIDYYDYGANVVITPPTCPQ